MGFFSGLFEKKICDFCGNEIKFFGNKKVEDGNMCKDCASKLSPFFSDRRRSTVEQIREQLAYREANKAHVAAFNLTRTLGNGRKVLIDDHAGKFMVTSSSHWRDENPDVMDLSSVTGVTVEVKERRTEIKHKDAEGKDVSYDPPRYDVDFDIYDTIQVNNPYFDDIEIKINQNRIEHLNSAEFVNYKAQADEIKAVLMGAHVAAAAAYAPKTASMCPFCGASTIPDANGRCEYCGGAMS